MNRLPLFPLPQTVVFPGLLVPLYIFEDRYRQMIRDLLAAPDEERRFIITLAVPGGFREVGAYVDLLQTIENPDGTFNIFCRGGERCRLEGAGVFDKPYQTTLHAPYPLERSEQGAEAVAAWDALDAFRGYISDRADPKALEEAISNLSDDPLYQSTFVCVHLDIESADKQALLEAPSLVERFELAQTLMRQERLEEPAEA